jgi:DNA-binding response OmpR family regulator
MRVLVVEDSPEELALLEPLLVAEGFEVRTATDGEEGLRLVEEFEPELVVLDVVLPTVDGIEVCRRLRGMSDAYVIMVTSKSEEIDRVVGLSVGADDYVTKPFYPRELVARIKAMSRRPRRAQEGDPTHSARQVGDIGVDPAGRRVTVAGEEVSLTKIEFDLLDAITERPRQVHTREVLRERVWGGDWFGDDHVVDVHIGNLRKKIDGGRKPSRIETVRGVGFRMRRDG